MPPIRRSARGASKPKGFWKGSTSRRKYPAKRNAKRKPRNFSLYLLLKGFTQKSGVILCPDFTNFVDIKPYTFKVWVMVEVERRHL